jgi:dipeptidyl aminopeptidase/acylaminoacyl peptidase
MLDASGELAGHTDVAGGRNESIFQPEWSPEGLLHFVSDRTGWWNLYRLAGEIVEPLCRTEAEFGMPQWGFALSTYAFESAWRIVCSYCELGSWRLASLDLMTGTFTPIDIGLRQPGRFLLARPGEIIVDITAPDEPQSIAAVRLEDRSVEVIRRSSELSVDRSWISIPRRITFPTSGGRSAYGIYYPPVNPEAQAPDDERPPLLVKSHGGPTGAAGSGLSLGIQYWTSRGIAVLDVDYGGSTGYGREYRERLNGQWGIVDVEDCINGARYLADRGEVDGARLLIDGGSAGGYTTLCALTFHTLFSAGASYYGVSDLELLEEETHKFEAGYSTTLVAPYPERRDIFRERSPIHHVEKLSTPMIFFQGLEDTVVPPNQAERMVDALRSRGIPVAYLPFEGEQHGFRRAENIMRALEAELYFYARVLGFKTADAIEPVDIDNLPAEG